MNATTNLPMNGILEASVHPWRPLFWEPVSGTGERLLVGVVHGYNGQSGAVRMLRDETLDCLFGKRSGGARKLIEHGLEILSQPLMGIYPGELRTTAARSLQELLRTAALLHSSLANLDKLDELEQIDAPLQDEVNQRFSTEVKEITLARRPDLQKYFGQSAELVEGGQRVKFGFCSPRVVTHFNVLYPIRPSASLRDARARLFELQAACKLANIRLGALIGAVARDDDATLSEKQRQQLREARLEIENEAKATGLVYYPVTTAQQGADQVIQLAA